jgi:hypothetical protein
MKFSIIFLLVAAFGSSDMLVSSQDEPSLANEIKKTSGQKEYVRGSHSHARRALLQWSITSPDLGLDQNVRLLRDCATTSASTTLERTYEQDPFQQYPCLQRASSNGFQFLDSVAVRVGLLLVAINVGLKRTISLINLGLLEYAPHV